MQRRGTGRERRGMKREGEERRGLVAMKRREEERLDGGEKGRRGEARQQ